MGLPTEKTAAQARMGKVLVFAEPKIGKSTLTVTLDPEHTIALDVEDGLSAIEAYKHRITSWGRATGTTGEGRNQQLVLAEDSFRGAIKLLHEEEHPYKVAVVDTADALAALCTEYVLSALGAGAGYVHASDFEYGKGWDAINKEWALRIGALCRVVESVVLVSHANVKTMKDRTGEEYPVYVPALGPKGILNWTTGFVDHILFMRMEENGDGEELRAVHTQPTRSWQAGGRTVAGGPQLPDPIWLPDAATSGQALRQALEAATGALPAQKPQATDTKAETNGAPQAARKPAQGRGSRAKAKAAEASQQTLEGAKA